MGATGGAHGHGEHRSVLDGLNPQHRALRSQIPEVYKGFAALSAAAFADGVVPRRIKELVALAIAVVHGCDGCIASHAQAAARAGATKEEAAEMIGVTFLMMGGPATIYGARAYTAFCEFADGNAEGGES